MNDLQNLKDVGIVSDTLSGISLEEAEAANIYILPLSFAFDSDDVFLDTPQAINDDIFFDKLSKFKGSTSITPIKVVIDFFINLLEKYKKIFYLCASSKMTAQFRTCSYIIKSNEFLKEKIKIIDTFAISTLLRKITLKARNVLTLADNEPEANLLVADILKNYIGLIIPFDLNRLKNSGRFTQKIAQVINMLKIKIIVRFKEGFNDKCGIALTWQAAVIKCFEVIRKEKDINKIKELYIVTTPWDKTFYKEFLCAQAQKFGFNNIVWQILPRIITFYTGINTVQFFALEENN